jgi:hypothetical protein
MIMRVQETSSAGSLTAIRSESQRDARCCPGRFEETEPDKSFEPVGTTLLPFLDDDSRVRIVQFAVVQGDLERCGDYDEFVKQAHAGTYGTPSHPFVFQDFREVNGDIVALAVRVPEKMMTRRSDSPDNRIIGWFLPFFEGSWYLIGVGYPPCIKAP